MDEELFKFNVHDVLWLVLAGIHTRKNSRVTEKQKW